MVDINANKLIDELKQVGLSHKKRMQIGDLLCAIGDPRDGIGLNERGEPAIYWCTVKTHHSDRSPSQIDPAFQISKYLVTNVQMRAFFEAEDGYSRDVWWDGLALLNKCWEQEQPCDNYAADTMNWYTAVAFSRWLSHRLGYEVRLPTEREWELAATGGDPNRLYPWGSLWDERFANTRESFLGQPVAVGLYPHSASPCGAMDMSGNMWEWCVNEYDNQEIISIESGAWKTVRGGAFWTDAESARTKHRQYYSPINQFAFTGFRLVRFRQS